MTNEKLRTFYNERRRKGPGLIALGVIGVINWIVSDVLNFSSLVSQLEHRHVRPSSRSPIRCCPTSACSARCSSSR